MNLKNDLFFYTRLKVQDCVRGFKVEVPASEATLDPEAKRAGPDLPARLQ